MRKKNCFISAVMFWFLSVLGSSVFAETVIGDIDGDKKISLKESVYSLQIMSGLKPAVTFTLQSDAFDDGTEIPKKYACTYCAGLNISPQLSWSNPPLGTKSFALIMDDPDATTVSNGKIWYHWIVYDIPAETTSLSENAGAQSASDIQHGLNSYSNTCGPDYYGGPCPPEKHRYYFRLYALDVQELKPEFKIKDGIDAAMRGHILGEAELMGTYTPGK